MLTKRIIPCLDVKGGRVIKGVKFREHRDAGDPVELAAFYNEQGADELVFYDITASSDKRGIMLEVVERTASQVFIPLTVGGGLRTVEDIRRMLEAGADKVSINTAAGLAAAIPAVLGYNHFLGRLRRLGTRMENFSSEFESRADRVLNLRS